MEAGWRWAWQFRCLFHFHIHVIRAAESPCWFRGEVHSVSNAVRSAAWRVFYITLSPWPWCCRCS